MSNSDPSAIVLHGIPCIGGLYTSFDSNGENGFARRSLRVRRDSLFLDRALGLELISLRTRSLVHRLVPQIVYLLSFSHDCLAGSLGG